MRLKKFSPVVCIVFSMLCLLIFSSSAMASKSSKVLILPFKINSDKDLSFLKKGIGQMLLSRLTLEEKVIPVLAEGPLPGTLTDSEAIAAAKKISAAYVLTGNMTIFGNSISTDGKFINTETGEVLVNFNKFGENQGDAIAHVNLFASQIAYQVFGYTIGSFQTNQVGINARAARPTVEMWKSKTFKTEMVSFSVGDIDSDGKNETVLIDSDTVYVYRYLDRSFAKIAEYKAPRQLKLVTVDAADINRNGKAEIFVSAQSNSTQRMNSFVLEWDGKDLSLTAQKMKWHFRAITLYGQKEKVLLGQRSGTGKNLFSGPVFEMAWENGSHVPAETQSIPSGLNVYSFTYGDTLNDGSEMVFNLNGSGHLQVSEHSGKPKWKSGEVFGGNPNHLDYNLKKDKNGVEDYQRFYIPQRLFVTDIDKDGKNEMLSIKNKDVTGDLFARFKSYSHGQIEVFNWNIAGPMVRWKTQRISGHLSDFTLGDMNNDGRIELIYTVVKKGSSSIGTTKRSYIMFQEPLAETLR